MSPVNEIVLDKARLVTLFKGYDALVVGPAARHILDGAPLPSTWTIIISGQLLPYNKESLFIYREETKDYLSTIYNMVVKDQINIAAWLRETPRGKDGIALHLATNCVLMIREYWSSPHQIILGRTVRRETP